MLFQSLDLWQWCIRVIVLLKVRLRGSAWHGSQLCVRNYFEICPDHRRYKTFFSSIAALPILSLHYLQLSFLGVSKKPLVQLPCDQGTETEWQIVLKERYAWRKLRKKEYVDSKRHAIISDIAEGNLILQYFVRSKKIRCHQHSNLNHIVSWKGMEMQWPLRTPLARAKCWSRVWIYFLVHYFVVLDIHLWKLN